jgi:hypothetical protein
VSGTNADLVPEWTDAFNRRDFDAFLAFVDDEVVVESRLVAWRVAIAGMRECDAGGTTSSGPFLTTQSRSRTGAIWVT